MSGRKEFANRFRRVSGIYNIVDDKQIFVFLSACWLNAKRHGGLAPM